MKKNILKENEELSKEIDKCLGDIGLRLKEAQKERNLTGIKIAKEAEMSQVQISRMLNGKNTNMTISTIYKLANTLNVEPAWLAFGTGNKTK